ncbi:MAG: virulence factor SrfB [Acetobacteraceae bacterium]|nr:virulence factor SrfB [Acetobacteraceae bacterium]
MPITAAAAQLDQVVVAALGPVLADLCEVVWRMGCDWLLLSGRPCRLRAVMDIVLAKLPVPAHRVLAMDRFRVGRWYPFRDAAERIADPKTTAAVGAVLATLAEGRLEGFLLRASRFGMKSTARFMGVMEHTGQVLDHNLFPVDLDRAPKEAPVEVKLTFGAPCFVGFRQLAVERWRATPLYWLDYSNPANVADLALPLTISIERAELDIEDEDSGRAPDDSKREDFRIIEIVNARGDPVHPRLVDMRLQTLKDSSGYWRDTGALEVP